MIVSVVLTALILPIANADNWDVISPFSEPDPELGHCFYVTEQWFYAIDYAIIYFNTQNLLEHPREVDLPIYDDDQTTITGYYKYYLDQTSAHLNDLGSNGGVLSLRTYDGVTSLYLDGPSAGAVWAEFLSYSVAYFVSIQRFDIVTGARINYRYESGYIDSNGANTYRLTNDSTSVVFAGEGHEKAYGYGLTVKDLAKPVPLILWGSTQDWQEDLDYIRSNAVIASTALNQIMFYLGSWENRWVEAESIRQEYQDFVENSLYGDFIDWFSDLDHRLAVIASRLGYVYDYLDDKQSVELTTINRGIIEANSYLYNIENYLRSGNVIEHTTSNFGNDVNAITQPVFDNDMTPDEVQHQLNDAWADSGGAMADNADQVKSWVTMFSNAKLMSVVVLALAAGTVILILGKNKNDAA